MKTTIEGKKFCITGDLEGFSRSEAQAKIVEAGGLIAKSMGPRTDVLVCGSGAGPSKVRKALSLGIPVLDEAELVELLSGASVESADVVASGDSTVRDLIGEARAALDGEPTSDTWSTLVELVDSCVLDQLPALVDFIAPQVARWQVAPHTRWTPSPETPGCEGAPKEWFSGMPRGELRVAPFRWLVEMNTKHPSPKHRLVRVLHTRGMKMTGSSFINMLSNEHLTSLTQLDLHSGGLTKTFWKKLRTLPSTKMLERLRFSEVSTATAEAAFGDHHLDALTQLDFYIHNKSKPAGFARLLASPMCQNVEVLTVGNAFQSRFLAALDEDEALLPRLRRIVLEGKSALLMNGALGLPVCARVDEVALRLEVLTSKPSEKTLGKMFAEKLRGATDRVAGPTLLDLSEVELSAPPDEPWDLEAIALRALDGWTPPRNVKKIRLGPLGLPSVLETISRLGIEPVD